MVGLFLHRPCVSISFTTLGKFSVIFSNRFSISCSLSSFGTPLMGMLLRLKLSQRLFKCCWHINGSDVPQANWLRGLAVTTAEELPCRG